MYLNKEYKIDQSTAAINMTLFFLFLFLISTLNIFKITPR